MSDIGFILTIINNFLQIYSVILIVRVLLVLGITKEVTKLKKHPTIEQEEEELLTNSLCLGTKFQFPFCGLGN